LAADVNFANDRNTGCLVRNADIGLLGLGSRGPNDATMPASVAEDFDKGLISP